MRWPPATVAFAIAALAVAALVPPAAAALPDEVAFTEAYYVRAAWGDIPRTNATEPSGQWNLVQYVRLQHVVGSPSTADVALPEGAALDGLACSCADFTARAQQAHQVVTVAAGEPTGPVVVAVRSHLPPLPGPPLLALRIPSPNVVGDAALNFFVPAGSTVDSNLPAKVAGLACTPAAGDCVIHQFVATMGRGGVPNPDLAGAWFAVHPSSPGPAAPPGSSTGPWLYAGAGVVGGALLWALLVSRGAVQRRSRRQVAAVAAHVEAATQEPAAVLEARKRFLLGALKDVELARQNGELEASIYDAVKADFKRQAVTVMRALEQGQAKT